MKVYRLVMYKFITQHWLCDCELLLSSVVLLWWFFYSLVCFLPPLQLNTCMPFSLFSRMFFLASFCVFLPRFFIFYYSPHLSFPIFFTYLLLLFLLYCLSFSSKPNFLPAFFFFVYSFFTSLPSVFPPLSPLPLLMLFFLLSFLSCFSLASRYLSPSLHLPVWILADGCLSHVWDSSHSSTAG